MIKALLRTLLIFIILLIAAMTFLLTPMGLRVSIDIAAKLLPGQLTYQKISGVIIGPITVDQLHYQDKETTLDIEKLRVNWHPLDLFKNELHIGTLDIQHLQVISNINTLPTQWNEQTIRKVINEFIISVENKQLPFHLIIDQADITQIQLNDPTTQTHIKKIFFHSIFTKEKWDTQLLAIINQPQPFEVKFDLLGKPTDYALHFTIKGNNTDWELIGNGNQQSFMMHTPKNLFLNGKLNANVKINWEPALDWQGQLTATNINLSQLNAQWINSLSLTIHSAGNNANQLTTDNEVRMQTPTGQLHVTLLHKNKWRIAWHLHLNALPHAKGNVDLRGKMDGDYHDQEWHGTLHQLAITLDRTNKWQLAKAVTLSASSNTFSITDTCLTSTVAGNICFQGQWMNQNMLGKAEINITRFDWLRALTKDVVIPSGQIHANLQMNGTLQKPNITGAVNFTQGSIFIRDLNITLNRISAAITSTGQTININAQAYSRDKPLNLQGSIDLSQPHFLAKATLTSNQALVLNTDEYTAYATSNLTATIDNQNIFLSGNITVPKGLYQSNDRKITTTLPDNDIVFTGTIVRPAKPFWLIHNNVTINFGNNIHINTAGVKAQLGGTLLLTQQPGQDMFATGSIFTRKGTFTVYGQTLTIAPNSYLGFSHSLLNNPTLDLKASKIIHSINNLGSSDFTENKLVVGVEIHGTLKARKITFFSNRSSLSQADILSYLLLGYGNASDEPGNADFLLRALSAVNISSQGLLGSQNIASEIESGLGLSEMGVESETTTDAIGNPLNRQSAFVVGKHLSKRFYVRYSIGILNPVNTFELRYLFNKRWAIQTDSSTLGNGMDVLYTFEQD